MGLFEKIKTYSGILSAGASNSQYTITASGLESGELRASRIPDSCLYTASVSFRAEGNAYEAFHANPNSDNGSRPASFLVIKSEAPIGKFDRVVDAVAGLANGRRQKRYRIYGSNTSDSINLPGAITQSGLAELVDKYAQNFSDVRINEVHYKNVPSSAAHKSRLPERKLTIQKIGNI